jgi:hypothetical protein
MRRDEDVVRCVIFLIMIWDSDIASCHIFDIGWGEDDMFSRTFVIAVG